MTNRLSTRAPVRHCTWLLLAFAITAACDRREQGVEGDLSPETGISTPTPEETPPSDPASSSGTTAPDDTPDSSPGGDGDR